MLSVCVCLSVCLDVNQGSINHSHMHTKTCNLTRTDPLINADCTPKTRSVWPTIRVKISHQKVVVNRHFHASQASQPVRYLLSICMLCTPLKWWQACSATAEMSRTVRHATEKSYYQPEMKLDLLEVNDSNQTRWLLSTSMSDWSMNLCCCRYARIELVPLSVSLKNA